MVSFYYDDCTLQDWEPTAMHAQSVMGQVLECLGFPCAADKRQSPSFEGDFLGMIHDLSAAHLVGKIQLWIRPRLQDKIQDFIRTARRDRLLHPGTAAKLFGCVTFLDQAAFGKVARAGLNAIKDRQHVDTSVELTTHLEVAFDVIETVLSLRPRRTVSLVSCLEPRMIAASDAAHERGKGSGGFLFSDAFFCRRGAVVEIDAKVFQLWQAKELVIAQLELLMVFQALICFPDSFRRNTCVWWIDNIASLMSLVRGRSDSPDLDRLAQMIHMLLFNLHCNMWFEWVQSKSNWTDGISREGFADPFIREFSFTCHQVAVPHSLWQLPLLPLSIVFSFL